MEKKKLKSRIRLTIGNKILAAFAALMILYIINVAIIFFTRTTIQDVVTHSSEIIRPSQNAINDFISLVTRSKMLATNWVYLQSNEEDKQALRNLRNNEYPQLAATVRDLMPLWESDSQRMLMDSVFKKFDAVLKVQEEGIMKQLVSFDNYEDPVTKLLAEDVVANQVIPQSSEIIEILSHIATMQYDVTAESDVALIRSVRSLGKVTWILAAVFIGWGVVSTHLLMRSITVPVNFLKNIVVRLGRRELVEE